MDTQDKGIAQTNVYNSGLNATDWKTLRDVIWPFLHAKDPSMVKIPAVPDHLVDHPLVRMIQNYKETGDESFLDEAGKCLIPTEVSFGWYTALTK
jgi:hypothetical protein